MRRVLQRKAVRFAAIAGIVALALGGCASIPSSGSVKQGEAITSDNDDFAVDYIPSGPSKGASQNDILRGFIDAASSPQHSYAIARQYLSPKLQSTWNPDESVTVDQGVGRIYTDISGPSWELSVTPVADVDANGGYREVTSTTPVTLHYQFAKDAKGQWRISKAPNGVVIDLPTFNTVFSARPLYFYDPSFSYLVPDLRWFPSRASTPTRIVKALLAGPSKWLSQGAVVTAFPQGTLLTVDAVPAPDGRAEVDLNDSAGQANQLTLQRMKYQLQKSLLDGTTVGSVQLSIEGTAQNVADLSGASLPISDPQLDSRPIVYRSDSFGYLSGSTITDLPGISRKVVALHPTSATVTADEDAAAVLTAGGAYLVQQSEDTPVKVDSRPGLIAPAIDNYGYVWTVATSSPGALQVAHIADSTDSVSTSRVTTNWAGTSSIVSLAISRDGTRLVALLRSGTQSRLVAASIIRGEDNVPKALGEPLELTAGPATPVGVTWLDQLNVAVLSQTTKGETAVTTEPIGGQSVQTVGPIDGAAIVGATGVTPYWILTSAKSVQGTSGTGWQERIDKVALIATQMGVPH